MEDGSRAGPPARTRDAEWLVIGAGPCGLSVLDQLLSDGVPADDIAVVAPLEPSPAGAPGGQPAVTTAYEAALLSGALGKSSDGQGVSLESAVVQGTLSQYWGASCLPPPSSSAGAAHQSVRAAYARTASAWHVSAERDALVSLFPLTGESVGELPRKHMARSIVADARGLVGHSRLAVRSDGGPRACTGASLCFQQCPRSAPWRAHDELAALRERHPALTVLDDVATSLAAADGGATTVRLGAATVRARRVLVASGWRATTTLLGGRPPVLGARAELEQSTVIMAPVVLREAAAVEDFSGSLTYHDLVVPHLGPRGEVAALTQVYLPTHELAGRMLATAPRALAPAVRAVLAGGRTRTSLEWALRHVAVAMTFFPGSRDWEATTHERTFWRAQVAPDLRRVLAPVGGRPLPVKHVVLAQGQSQHVGAWTTYADVVPRLLAEGRAVIPGSVAGGRAAAVDPSLLPALPPGPHTATAAALARVLVSALVEQWT